MQRSHRGNLEHAMGARKPESVLQPITNQLQADRKEEEGKRCELVRYTLSEQHVHNHNMIWSKDGGSFYTGVGNQRDADAKAPPPDSWKGKGGRRSAEGCDTACDRRC